MSTSPSFVNLRYLLGGRSLELDELFWQKACELRVAIPAVVVAFNQVKQSVTVQPAIQENIFQNLVPTPVNLPQLADVPVMIYGAGGYQITIPITVGDECLIIFADMCINRWWIEGAPGSGPMPNQEERRRHDLSDGIALFGLWSNPRAIPFYNNNGLIIRSNDGHTSIVVQGGQVSITPDNGTTQIVVKTGEIDLIATTVKINGKVFLTHSHSGVASGGSDTGPVV